MDTEIVVLGGGAAGLAAAWTVARAGREVVVLEAAAAPGGRIRTVHVPGLAAAVELGAEFVHGDAPWSRKLWRASGARVERTSDRHHHASLDGPRRDESTWQRLDAVMMQLDPGEGADRSVAEMLGRAQAEPEVLDLARGYLTGFHALDPERASARGIFLEESGQSGAERMARIVEGQDHIVDGLLRSGLDVRTRTVVERVEHDGDRVVVHARGPLGAAVTITAHAAVIALPLGVLQARDVVFDPPLTWPLDAVAPGAVVRVVLLFDEPFWKQRVKKLSFLFGTGTYRAMWTMALVAWCGGPAARELSARPELERIDRAIEDLAVALSIPRGEVEGHLRGWHHHDWVNDPFARGAYAYTAVGGCERQPELAEPRGSLVLAGEYVGGDAAVSSTVESALQSGRRAAKLLLGAGSGTAAGT
jgi:monoamine oxidase